jgi:hypothetical protein
MAAPVISGRAEERPGCASPHPSALRRCAPQNQRMELRTRLITVRHCTGYLAAPRSSGALANMRHYNRINVLLIGLLLAACTSHETGSVQWRGQSFREVRAIEELPPIVQNTLGVGQPGLKGIAEPDGKFNVTDVIDSALPMQRFVLAGLSSDTALVVIEHGGRSHYIQASLIPLAANGSGANKTWPLSEKPKSLSELIAQFKN